MATQVLIAHTGQRLTIDTSQLASLDDFKALVARQSSIPATFVIALTIQGRPVKLQTAQSEREICIYDMRVAQAASPGASPSLAVESPLPKRYNVSTPPNHLPDHRSLRSWQELFKMRRVWARKVTDECRAMAQTANDRCIEMEVMVRCLDAAVANLESVVKSADAKYLEAKKWMGPTQTENTALVEKWEDYVAFARTIPISVAMLRFMTGRDVAPGKGRISRQATLEDLVDLDTARKTAKLAPVALRKFAARAAELDRGAPRLSRNWDELINKLEHTMGRSAMSHGTESQQLLQDIEAVARKIETDCETTLEYSDSTRDVLQASKIAANHTERLLPTIQNRAKEMDDMLRYAIKARNAFAADSVEFMRTITELTSAGASIKTQAGMIDDPADLSHFNYLRLILNIPCVYATFVAEAIKRREWFEKVKTDSSTLANEMALFKDEEVKRRRKWHKTIVELSYGPARPPSDNQVPGLEVNLMGEDEEWPIMSRSDLDDFYDLLRRQKADLEVVEEVGKMMAELSSPTKQQSKRLKAFKNGSVHEAALGRSGLLIRGDDDVLRTLQDDKAKLENKLKTADSRVRRLEDLLHRQSQVSRPSLGNIFQPLSQHLSDRTESAVSVKSPLGGDDRRRSSESADLKLLQRVQQLEGELSTERERSAIFEKDLDARTTQNNDMKGRMDEVNSTKKDLLENMEALKREFIEERKSLEDEIKRLQARLEVTEDEIEHFGESRENEKTSYDEKVGALELEVERLNKGRRDDALKAQGQVEFLRKESKLQRERNEGLEKQLQVAQDELKSSAKRLQFADETSEMQLKALRDLYGQVSPGEGLPTDLGDLVDGVFGRTTDLISRLRDVEGDIGLLRADLDQAKTAARELKTELTHAKEKLSAEEMVALHGKDRFAEEMARVVALEAELSGGREQLDQLRIQIADGETGSETLRKRLEEEERKIVTLTEDLASRQSHLGSVEEELRLFQEKFHQSQSELSALESRFEARTERAKDLTQRLYTQNERLCRLLERLGFAVTREGNSMTIQKLSRSERSTLLLPGDQGDSAATARRSSLLGSRASVDGTELEQLYWMNNADAETESEKYAAFMSALGSFDVDAFSETMYRRVKDVEHLARKLQRDIRGYRERTHALQKDAHEKIAFKSFKEGDLALFLPTRNQTNGAWAAFNVGFPHYFLQEQEGYRLRNREWLVARISRIQEKVVDLSKGLRGQGETGSLNDEENDNPFDLSDGLRWYLIEAMEDKPGAPSTPGLGKSTVAANNVEAMADMTHARSPSGKGLGITGRHSGIENVSKTLSKSLESRRSSTSSRKALPFAVGGPGRSKAHAASETNSLRAAAPDTLVATSPTLHQAQPQPPPPAHSSESPQRTSTQSPPAADQQPRPEPRVQLAREQSTASVDSQSKKSVVWDPLWSLDINYDSSRKGR